MTEQQNITELITRYETWLKMPFIPTKYYPNEEIWRQQVEAKLKELKQKLNDKNDPTRQENISIAITPGRN